MVLELVLLIAALATALMLRPWRMLKNAPLVTPMLATLVILPWIWALPTLQGAPLQLQWSGACLVVLMLGWPLAVLALVLVAILAALISSTMSWPFALSLAVWQGIMPATLALAAGALLRKWIGAHPFVYVLGRAFLGSVACVFMAGILSQWAGHGLPSTDTGLSVVARWLMAWSDGIVTGMLCAIFVAYRPQWLATWSDSLYLHGLE